MSRAGGDGLCTVRAPLARIHAYVCTAMWPRIVAIVRDNLQRAPARASLITCNLVQLQFPNDIFDLASGETYALRDDRGHGCGPRACCVFTTVGVLQQLRTRPRKKYPY